MEKPFFTSSVNIGGTDCRVEIRSSVYDAALKFDKVPDPDCEKLDMNDYTSVDLVPKGQKAGSLAGVETWFNKDKKICSFIRLKIKNHDERHIAFLAYALLELLAVTGVTESYKGANYFGATVSEPFGCLKLLESSGESYSDMFQKLGFFSFYDKETSEAFNASKVLPPEARVFFGWRKSLVKDSRVSELLAAYTEGSQTQWLREYATRVEIQHQRERDQQKPFEYCSIS